MSAAATGPPSSRKGRLPSRWNPSFGPWATRHALSRTRAACTPSCALEQVGSPAPIRGAKAWRRAIEHFDERRNSASHRHRRRGRAQVTLVDRNGRHLWKPLLHEVAAGRLDADVHGIDYLALAYWHYFRF